MILIFQYSDAAQNPQISKAATKPSAHNQPVCRAHAIARISDGFDELGNFLASDLDAFGHDTPGILQGGAAINSTTLSVGRLNPRQASVPSLRHVSCGRVPFLIVLRMLDRSIPSNGLTSLELRNYLMLKQQACSAHFFKELMRASGCQGETLAHSCGKDCPCCRKLVSTCKYPVSTRRLVFSLKKQASVLLICGLLMLQGRRCRLRTTWADISRTCKQNSNKTQNCGH